MVKRVVATVLWFVVITWGYNYLGYYLGLPFLGGPVIGTAVAAFVALDPMNAIWPRKADAEPAERSPEPLETGVRSAA
jgi:hypothetical protein